MKNKKILCILPAVMAGVIVIATSSPLAAVGLGVYATVGGGTESQRTFHNKNMLPVSYLVLPGRADIRAYGGGLVLDTQVATLSVFNYRMRIGAELYTLKREEKIALTRARLEQVLGFAPVRLSSVRWWLGPVVSVSAATGSGYTYYNSITLYGARGGIATGLNIHLPANLSLSLDVQGLYGFTWVRQGVNRMIMLVPMTHYQINSNKSIRTMGYEIMGQVSILYRLGQDTPSRVRYIR